MLHPESWTMRTQTEALLNKDFRQAMLACGAAYLHRSMVQWGNQTSSYLFVPPTFVQVDGKSFVELVKKNW